MSTATVHAPPAQGMRVSARAANPPHATGYSIEGLKAGWGETAFRQEALAAFVLLPLSF